MLKVGDIAPDFTATATSGKTVKLSELRGKRVVMFFFPKAMTTGCTIETRLFRDHYTEMAALGAEVIGVSVDSNDKQCEFATREGVPFPMIGDSKKSIGKSFDVMWPILGITKQAAHGPLRELERQGLIDSRRAERDGRVAVVVGGGLCE